MLLVLALTKVVSQYSLVGTIEDAKVILVRPGWLFNCYVSGKQFKNILNIVGFEPSTFFIFGIPVTASVGFKHLDFLGPRQSPLLRLTFYLIAYTD